MLTTAPLHLSFLLKQVFMGAVTLVHPFRMFNLQSPVCLSTLSVMWNAQARYTTWALAWSEGV